MKSRLVEGRLLSLRGCPIWNPGEDAYAVLGAVPKKKLPSGPASGTEEERRCERSYVDDGCGCNDGTGEGDGGGDDTEEVSEGRAALGNSTSGFPSSHWKDPDR